MQLLNDVCRWLLQQKNAERMQQLKSGEKQTSRATPSQMWYFSCQENHWRIHFWRRMSGGNSEMPFQLPVNCIGRNVQTPFFVNQWVRLKIFQLTNAVAFYNCDVMLKNRHPSAGNLILLTATESAAILI